MEKSIIDDLSEEDIAVLIRFVSTLHGLKLGDLRVIYALQLECKLRALQQYLDELKK